MKRVMTLFICAVFTFALSSASYAASDREVWAEHGMVSAAHKMASEAGVEIMKKGGNAVDAAVATSLALSVVEGHFTGMGGGGFMTIRDAKTGEVVFLDYREMAPAAATKDMYASEQAKKEKWKSITGKSAGVPGWTAGMFYALEHYGTMSFAEVAEPAIRMAEEGWTVEPNQAKWYAEMSLPLMDYYDDMSSLPFINGELPYQTGEHMTRKDLAATYKLLAEKGPKAFYEGEIGEAFVKEVQRLGGIMTMDDLKNYKIHVKKPAEGTYRGYKIYSAPPASSGGTHIVQVLNILENFPLDKWAPDSAERQHVTAEAIRLMFADREQYMADSDFINVPLNGLVNKDYAKSLAEKIDMKSTLKSIKAGDPWQYETTKRVAYSGALTGFGSNTSHFSVADADGNIVSCTNTHNYVTGFVPGYGIIINNEMDDFSDNPESANAPEPGKRPLSSMAPTIVLTPDGKPFMTIGSAGATRIMTALTLIITNVIDYGMDMDEAINYPRFFTSTTGGKPAAYKVEDKMPQETLEKLKAVGETIDIQEYGDYFGTSQGILYKDGKMNGGADSRRLGVPVGF